METRIVIFFLIVVAMLWLLNASPRTPVSKAAFTWVGPRRAVGERRSSYEFRWATYSAAWLLQIMLIGSALSLAASFWPTLKAMSLWQASWFGLSLQERGWPLWQQSGSF